MEGGKQFTISQGKIVEKKKRKEKCIGFQHKFVSDKSLAEHERVDDLDSAGMRHLS